MSSKIAVERDQVCWDCTRQLPKSKMIKGTDCGLTVWRCGCDKGLPPFMTAVAGHVMFHHGITGETLPDAWKGICVSGDDTKAFWNIGFDDKERSYQKLPVAITTLREAKAYVANQQAAVEKSAMAGEVAEKIWKSLLNVRAVICEQLPGKLDNSWIIMNAPRPLLGDRVLEDGPMNSPTAKPEL